MPSLYSHCKDGEYPEQAQNTKLEKKLLGINQAVGESVSVLELVSLASNQEFALLHMKSSVFATSALVGNETSCPVCPIREEKTKLMHLELRKIIIIIIRGSLKPQKRVLQFNYKQKTFIQVPSKDQK